MTACVITSGFMQFAVPGVFRCVWTVILPPLSTEVAAAMSLISQAAF